MGPESASQVPNKNPNFINPPPDSSPDSVIDTGPKFDSPVLSTERHADYPPVNEGRKYFRVINAQPPLK